MNLTTLKYFVSVAELGSLTAAAEAHFVTQPALSVGLRKLQEELGAKLVAAKGRGMRLTGAGEIVLDYARRFARLEEELSREIADLEGLVRGKIAIGTIDAASSYVLPRVFSRFRERYPGIDIALEVMATESAPQGAQSGPPRPRRGHPSGREGRRSRGISRLHREASARRPSGASSRAQALSPSRGARRASVHLFSRRGQHEAHRRGGSRGARRLAARHHDDRQPRGDPESRCRGARDRDSSREARPGRYRAGGSRRDQDQGARFRTDARV